MNLAIVWTTSVLLLCTSFAWAGETIDKVLDVKATGHVTIESMNGKIEIIGWDKAQVAVKGELDDKARGYEFETEDGYTIFKVNMPKSSRKYRNGGKGSRLTIHIPVKSKLEFESVNGTVSVRDIAGGANVHTVNGHIKARDLQNRIKLKTVNGNVSADSMSGKITLATVNGKVQSKGTSGRVSFETVNGSIEADCSATQVYAENVNGSLDLNLAKAEEVEVSTVNGDVDVSVSLVKGAQINITTVSGSAYLAVSGEIGGDYRLNSHAGGSIRNRLTDDKVKSKRYGPSKSLRFDIAGGDARVEMTSVSGDLTIKEK